MMSTLKMMIGHWPIQPKNTGLYKSTCKHTDNNSQFYQLWFDKAKSANNLKSVSPQDHNTLKEWKISKKCPFKSSKCSQSKNWQKPIFPRIPHPSSNVIFSKISNFKTTTSFWIENNSKSVLSISPHPPKLKISPCRTTTPSWSEN